MHDNFDPRFWIQPVDDARPLVVWLLVLAAMLAVRWFVPEAGRLDIVHSDLWYLIAAVTAVAAAGLVTGLLALWARLRS